MSNEKLNNDAAQILNPNTGSNVSQELALPPTLDEIYAEFMDEFNVNRDGFEIVSVNRCDDKGTISIKLQREQQDMVVFAEGEAGHHFWTYSGTWNTSLAPIPLPEFDSDDSDAALQTFACRDEIMSHIAYAWDR